MDYSFTDSEILFVYAMLRKQVSELMMLKDAGQATLVRQDLKIRESIINKIEIKHPGFTKLPG